MLGKEMLQQQFNYNLWANEIVLKKSMSLDDDQFVQSSRVGERTLIPILAHMAIVEHIWRLLAEKGQIDPTQLPSEESMTTVAVIQKFINSEHETMIKYLDGLDESDLASNLTITSGSGKKVSMARWQMLSHLLLHSMQHRSEAASILTELSQSPGDIDFLFFVLGSN